MNKGGEKMDKIKQVLGIPLIGTLSVMILINLFGNPFFGARSSGFSRNMSGTVDFSTRTTMFGGFNLIPVLGDLLGIVSLVLAISLFLLDFRKGKKK
jgi:hypothetical protein